MPKPWLTAGLWVQKVRGAENCNFLTDSCKFPMEEIMAMQNFKFAP